MNKFALKVAASRTLALLTIVFVVVNVIHAVRKEK